MKDRLVETSRFPRLHAALQCNVGRIKLFPLCRRLTNADDAEFRSAVRGEDMGREERPKKRERRLLVVHTHVAFGAVAILSRGRN